MSDATSQVSVSRSQPSCSELGYRWARMKLRDNFISPGDKSVLLIPLATNIGVTVVQVPSDEFKVGISDAVWESKHGYRLFGREEFRAFGEFVANRKEPPGRRDWQSN